MDHPYLSRMIHTRLLFSLLVLPLCGHGAEPKFEGAAAVIAAHCLECHGEKKQKGSIDFSNLKTTDTAMARWDVWRKVAEQVRSGEMPPDDEPPLKPAEKAALLSWISEAFDTSKRPHPGPPLTRQMTRFEYNQTMRDLLRINFDPAYQAGMPDENVPEGFVNRAGGLVLEPSLMEKYFTAADLALDNLFKDNNARKFLLGAPDATTKPEAAARKVLSAFLRRAFRRPVPMDEVEPLARLADAALASGDALDLAIHKAMKPALVSQNFLLRMETSPAKAGAVAQISDHELAVRLSYFLWATMPDDELFAVADSGALAQPEVLEKQVRRMLTDRKAETLTRHFLERWLQLPALSKALPSQNAFPAYTRSLRDAMERETRMFCDTIRKEDRSLLEVLDADYTFVNTELAKHYGLPAPEGKDFVKVALRPDDHRGGVIGMGSMLTMTSHTNRTKPTARGKWVLEVLLGAPPPPPPPAAGSFAPQPKDKPEPASFREKLAQHAADANCVGCHLRVDPMGFALEEYDAVGTWRADVGGQPLDNVGKLPGVGDFKGVAGLRKVLHDKQPQFVRNVAAQALSYALGRDTDYYDEPALDRIVAALASGDYRFSTLMLEVAKSFPFQHRKSE